MNFLKFILQYSLNVIHLKFFLLDIAVVSIKN